MCTRIIKYLTCCLAMMLYYPADAGSVTSERAEFVIGNAYYVLLHEFAHVIIHDFDIPMLGNEEDAADTLASTALINLDRRPSTKKFRFRKMLLMAADANRIMWQRGMELESIETAYWANHPLSAQRAARISCLILGSDIEALAALPDLVDMPLFRADRCEEEFEQADAGRAWVRATYGSSAQADSPELITVYYQSTEQPSHRLIESFLKEERMLEQTADLVSSYYALPEVLNLSMRSCGLPDAYWDGDAREVVLCYELLEAFYKMSAGQKAQELVMRLSEIQDEKQE